MAVSNVETIGPIGARKTRAHSGFAALEPSRISLEPHCHAGARRADTSPYRRDAGRAFRRDHGQRAARGARGPSNAGRFVPSSRPGCRSFSALSSGMDC